ncbi:MAG: hypothetical protein K0S46_91 [Moraxellaceae bacterium]|jgi:hypothetical protein|nr:hypothetical protein [Moraxellaceae bacterium]
MRTSSIGYWEKIRAKGRARFILVNGMLGYGISMFFAMTFFVLDDPITFWLLVSWAVIWLIGGAIFGALIWYVQERQYNKVGGSKKTDGA